RNLVFAPPCTEILLAQRAALLMKLAARSLFRRCRRVLHTDLEWPGYIARLESERDRSRGATVSLPVRDLIFREAISVEDLVRITANQYREEGCEGLFLSAVSYEGVRFPVRELTDVLSITKPPRFVVIDGSQALAHAPEAAPPCDFLLGGTHKWA